MKRAVIFLVALAVASMASVSRPASAQSAKVTKVEMKAPPPRLPNGKPDFSGNWTRPAARDMTESFTNPNGTSTKGEPNPLPFTPWGQKQWDNYNPVKNGDFAGSCMPFGWIRSFHPHPMQIIQNNESIAFLFEQSTMFQLVNTEGLTHRKDWPPTWFGDSRGHWDGDALVIEAVNFNGWTKLGTIGHPMSDQAKLTMTFKRPDMGHIQFKWVLEDSKTYTHVKYQRLTPYDELPATRGEFRLRASGWDDTEPIATQTGHLDSGKRYTVVALRDAEGNMALNVIADNLAPASEGKAKVRLINAASQFGEVDVIRQNDKKLLFNGVNVNTATGYEDVDASTTTLEVREKGQNRPALRIPNITLEAGKMYTIVVAGGTADTPLQAIPIEDELTQSVALGL